MNNNFVPFSMNNRGPIINHLAYVDDIIIFSSGNCRSIRLIMKQIKRYENCSGKKVNKEKSSFLPGPKTCAY